MPSGTDFGVVSPGEGGSNFLTMMAYQSGPVSAVLQTGGKGAFQLISMQSYRRIRTFPGGGLHNPQLRKPEAPRSAGLSPHVAPIWDWVLDQQGTDSLANVSKGEMIEIIVNFYAPSLELAPNVPENDTYTATLSIDGPGTQVQTFTLTALRGAFVVTPTPAQFSTRHGLETSVALDITSLCGPATDAVFQNQSNEPSLEVSVTPTTIDLPRASTVHTTAAITASGMPLTGAFGLSWPVSAFDGKLTLYVEEAVTILESSSSVQVWSNVSEQLVLVQSVSSSFTVNVAITDLATQFTISPGTLPKGVALVPTTPLSVSVPDIGSASISFSLIADTEAATGDAGTFEVNWSAYNGQVTGVITADLMIQPEYPPQLDFDFNPITLGDGTPVGGFAHLTLRQDGTYTFSGHFHDSGATEYDMSIVVGIKDSENFAYAFPHTGHVSGTFESGPRDDDWNVNDQYPLRSWAALAASNTVAAVTKADSDWTALVDSVAGLLGTILGVIAMVPSSNSQPPNQQVETSHGADQTVSLGRSR
jgi:hypothetical protein